MISPKDFVAYEKKYGDIKKFKTPKAIIFCYSKSLMDYIVQTETYKKVRFEHSNLYLLTRTKSRVAIVGGFGIGAPIVVTLLEELIALGVKKFITIGTAGTLQKNIGIGNLVICNKAIRDEGTSYHYARPAKYAYASKNITQKLRNALDKLNRNYFIGTSWTIDAPYRETVAEAKQYQKEGVMAVDMEASAIFSVAKYRKVEAGSLFSISDSLAWLEWDPKFHTKRTKNALVILYDAALLALKLK